MSKSKGRKVTVTTIAGLAAVIADGFSDMAEGFDGMNQKFLDLQLEMRNGFEETNKKLDRIDTRIAALELAVFGATTADGARLLEHSLLTGDVERVKCKSALLHFRAEESEIGGKHSRLCAGSVFRPAG